MPIYLDGKATELAGEKLGAVIDAAQKRLAGSGRVLVEIQLNGRSLVGDEIETQRDVGVAGADLKLESADPRQLAVQTLEAVRVGLDDARVAQGEAADLLQRDQPTHAMEQIGRAVEVWQQTQQAVLHTTMLLGIDLSQRQFEGKPITATTDALLANLRTLRDAIANRDLVALADSLNYEWPETTAKWDRLIAEIIKWVNAGE